MQAPNSVVILSLAVGWTSLATAQMPEITVIETIRKDDTTNITPGVSAAPTPDSMDIIRRLPGAAVNANGPLSAQAQYRGLFGPRLSVRVDDMRVTPGGLNWMDSPMHYLPPGLTRTVTLTRGIAPISAGPGIGGLIQAESKRVQFTDSDRFTGSGDLVTSAMSNTGKAGSLLLGLSNRRHRGQLIGSYERGGTQDFADGKIGATRYERATYGAGYGFNWGDGKVSIDYTHTDTDSSGTPALPLDIDFFDTDRVNLGLQQEWGGVSWDARLFYTKIDHGMNNYSLRTPPNFFEPPPPPPPPPPFLVDEDRRTVGVDMKATGFAFSGTLDALGGTLKLGLDGNDERHSGIVKDPDFAPFYVENFEDATSEQYGLYAEWRGDLGEAWGLEVGLRWNHTETDADKVDAFPADLAQDTNGDCPPTGGMAPGAVCRLRNDFNGAGRGRDDDELDAVVKLDYTLSSDLALQLAYAHRTRAPSYIERYLWIPLEVNSGLGDFNNYVGDIGLKPEVSDQVELGLEWSFQRGFFNPRVFYRHVADYIQGVAAADTITDPQLLADVQVVSTVNGDSSPLQFTNTEAELYGADAVFRYALVSDWRIDGIVSYVRGKNQDLDDNLYRIAPLNGRLALTWEQSSWSATAEGVFAGEQDKISRTIVLDEPRTNDQATSGYGILNLYAQWRSPGGLQLRAGVENLLDNDYTVHTAGFNRVSNSDVPIGDRLRGAGINYFGQVAYSW
jgi:iron complex outermembrane receptor protein